MCEELLEEELASEDDEDNEADRVPGRGAAEHGLFSALLEQAGLAQRMDAHVTGVAATDPDVLTAVRTGGSVTTLNELGRDVLTFARMDGVAENFHTEQNRELLEKLSQQTGGRYWKPSEVSRLPGEISYSEAGITVRDTKDLWNMPILFILILLLRSSEWLLRRKWGVV